MVYWCNASGETKVKVAGLLSHRAWPLMASLTKGQLALFLSTPRHCTSTCQATGWQKHQAAGSSGQEPEVRLIIPGSESLYPAQSSHHTPGQPPAPHQKPRHPLCFPVSRQLLAVLCCADILLFKCGLWMLSHKSLGVCLRRKSSRMDILPVLSSGSLLQGRVHSEMTDCPYTSHQHR